MAKNMSIWYPEEGDYVILKRDIKDGYSGEKIVLPKGTVFSILSVDTWRSVGPDSYVEVRSGEFDCSVQINELEEKTSTEEEYNASVGVVKEILQKADKTAAEKKEKRERNELLRLISKYGIPEEYR